MSNEELSPFCRDLVSKDELLGAYSEYFTGSRIFANNTTGPVNGETDRIVDDDDEDEDEETDQTVGDNANLERLQGAIDAALEDEDK